MNMPSIEQLNRDFAIADQLGFVEGEGGFPYIEIDNGKASALISLYAGQVLSFRPAHEPEDLLFLSGKAYYREGKAIKGGIPICWPWFGPDPEGMGRPSHGFVRNRYWAVTATETTPEGETKVMLEVTNNEETQAIWPNAFNLVLEISIGSSLTVKLIARNTGDRSYQITQALHTYFRVGDIGSVKLLGLEGLGYLDKVEGGREKIQKDEVDITAEVDRIYQEVTDDLTIVDASLGRRILIRAIGSRTAVVWNPWSSVAREMADLEDEDYRRLLCVETANAADEIIEIPAGGESRLIAQYSIVQN